MKYKESIVFIILGILVVVSFGIKNSKESKEQKNHVSKWDNIRYDTNTDIHYVDNILIVYMAEDYTEDDLDYVLNILEGEVAGSIPAIDQFQIKIKPSAYEELLSIIKELEEYDFIDEVFIDEALQISLE